MKVAFLLVTTTWLAGAEQPPAAPAPPAAKAPPAAMTPAPPPQAAYGGGYHGYSGGCNSCCEESCCEESGFRRFCNKIKGRFRRDCDDCCNTCCEAAPATTTCCDSGCDSGCHSLFGKIKGKFRRHSDDCCCVPDCCGSYGGAPHGGPAPVMQPGAPGATGKEPLKMPSEGKPPAPPAPGKKETSQIQTPGSLNLGN